MKKNKGWIIGGMALLLILLAGIIVYIQWLSPRPDYMSAVGVNIYFIPDIDPPVEEKMLKLSPQWVERIRKEIFLNEISREDLYYGSFAEREKGHPYNTIMYYIPSRSTRWFDFKKFKFSYKYTEEDKNFNQMTHRSFEKLLEKNPEIYGIKRMP